MNKSTSILIGLVVVALGVAMAFTSNRALKKPLTTLTATTTTGSYTMTQVATHKNAASCWTVISGTVYDLTQWISEHPGGEDAILSICGIDGSEAFNNQHGGEQKQADILATYKIGRLTK